LGWIISLQFGQSIGFSSSSEGAFDSSWIPFDLTFLTFELPPILFPYASAAIKIDN